MAAKKLLTLISVPIRLGGAALQVVARGLARGLGRDMGVHRGLHAVHGDLLWSGGYSGRRRRGGGELPYEAARAGKTLGKFLPNAGRLIH